MSAVTLETLRAEYDAACAVYLSYAESCDVIIRPTVGGQIIDFGHEGKRQVAWNQLINAASMYEIARGHGLNAAMLYKLSDGTIDPREGGVP